MTRRADLKQEREAAMEKFGLDREAFMPTKSYLALSNEDSDLLTPEQQEEAIEMAGLGAFEKAIARCIGVSENMFMQALTRGKKLESSKYHSFAKRFYEARKQHMKRNLRVMNEAIGEGDWKPAAWQLERSFGFAKQEAVSICDVRAGSNVCGHARILLVWILGRSGCLRVCLVMGRVGI